jgi:hypothetical protein
MNEKIIYLSVNERIFNLLNKTDIVNLKMNSKTELTLLGQCHKAALWNLYGHR